MTKFCSTVVVVLVVLAVIPWVIKLLSFLSDKFYIYDLVPKGAQMEGQIFYCQ